MSRSGAERISAHRNNHGFWRSGLSVLICCHGLERISRECHGADRSRYPLVEKVTDYHGADIHPLEMSRIGADWAIRSVIIRITDYISIRTHPCLFSLGNQGKKGSLRSRASLYIFYWYLHLVKKQKSVDQFYEFLKTAKPWPRLSHRTCKNTFVSASPSANFERPTTK